MKDWQPHLDLARLCTALSDEILAATDQDVRQAHAECGHSIVEAALDVRELIADLSGDEDESAHGLLAAESLRMPACARPH